MKQRRRANFGLCALLVGALLPLVAQPLVAQPLVAQPLVAQPGAVPTATASSTAAPAPAPGKAARSLSAARYRTLLQDSAARLRALERRAPRDLRPVVRDLSQPLRVVRGDGEAQTTSADSWQRWNYGWARQGTFNPSNATREQTRELLRTVEAHLEQLNAWAPASGAGYTAVDATKIAKSLEASGEIRTGPTWWQTFVDNTRAAFVRAWDAFLKWMDGLTPNVAPTNVPDFSWLYFVFWAIIIALVGLILFLVARALVGSGRWGRRRSKMNEGGPLDPEDAALLLLPPDELRERAYRFAAEGDFREALRHRFIGLLLLLDARGWWRYDKRRTNWEHISALGRIHPNSALVAPISDATRRFDRVRYGDAPCDLNDWERFESLAMHLENASQNAAATVGGGAREAATL